MIAPRWSRRAYDPPCHTEAAETLKRRLYAMLPRVRITELLGEVANIEESLKQVKNGQFASDEEVQRAFDSFGSEEPPDAPQRM